MAVEAPYSKYKRHNLLIVVALLIGFGTWFFYDGYFNQEFISKHNLGTKEKPEYDDTLKFNRYSPPFFFVGGGLVLVYFFFARKRKVIADEDKLIIDNKQEIPYEKIGSLDKTHFDSKGVFFINYEGSNGGRIRKKLSIRRYDNLGAVLEQVVSKIS